MNKGLTLIELLAVIIVLGIIALITAPTIMDVIDNAKLESFKNSAYGIVEAGEMEYAQDMLSGIGISVVYTYENGVESSSVSGKTLDYKGEKPKNGVVVVNGNGEVAIAIHDGTYCAKRSYEESVIQMSEVAMEDCKLNDDKSGASVPELTNGMIPVKWDGVNWVKADINNVVGTYKWYDYDEKLWANAVTVTSAKRTEYEVAAVGTEISMEDINTMWVWIPRYKYAIPSGTGPREINVVFESKDVTKSTGTAVDTDYLTHPAFTFGTDEVSGMWVGKFETTGDITSPTILPDTVSIRNQTVSAMYNASRTLENNATYGTSSDTDIHMMKNSEWGAAAYLAYSKYGKNGEIWKNNSGTYTTGCAGDSEGAEAYDGCQYQYHTNNGQNASTTGNIYGIYDMSGGGNEYVMAMYRPTLSYSVSDNSGFYANTSVGLLPDDKYWDRYTTASPTTACDSDVCYGEGLSETSDWYSFSVYDAYSNRPWLYRGGSSYSTFENTRLFYYFSYDGRATVSRTFRIVQMKI